MYINEFNMDSRSTRGVDADSSVPYGQYIIRFLRLAGTLLVILSAVGFMLQSHADVIPAYRYWVSLAIIVALCAGGLACNYLLKESTGARLFFALGTAFLPVQVSQVSAMLYAYVSGGQAQRPDFDWMVFSDVHPGLIGVDVIITAALLIAVSYTGFSMLAKRNVKSLMQALLFGSLVLFLPVREGLGLPVLIIALFAGLRIVESRLRQDATMRVAEGQAARGLIWLPLLILVGRSLLYPLSFWLALAVLVIVAMVGIVDVKRYSTSALAIYTAQWIGTLAAVSIWPLAHGHFVGDALNMYSQMIPVALMLFILSTQVTYHARLYRVSSSIAAASLVFAALFGNQAFAPLLAISTGIALIVVGGLVYREKVPFFAGHACFLGGILFYCGYVVDAYNSAPWVFSICLGLAVLMLASVLEKKQTVIVKVVGNYWNELKAWS